MQKSKYYTLIDANYSGINLNFKELMQYRDLIVLFVKREFVSKYKQTILGPSWAVIQPLLTTVVFTFIFGNVAGLANCGKVPTFLFYMCGNISWQFFSGCLSGTAGTFINNRGILGKVYFPRLCMPVSVVLGQMISLAIQSALFVVFLIIFLLNPSYEIRPNIHLLMVPVLIIHIALLALGCGIIISAVTTKYRDLQFLVSFGVSLWMYGTPVAYSIDIFGKGSYLYYLCRFNPMTPIIEMMRHALLGPDAGSADWLAYGISAGVTLIIVLFGVVLFNKVERTFMDTV